MNTARYLVYQFVLLLGSKIIFNFFHLRFHNQRLPADSRQQKTEVRGVSYKSFKSVS